MSEGLFSAVPFSQCIISGYQEKTTRHTKKKKKIQFEETNQSSESDTAEMQRKIDKNRWTMPAERRKSKEGNNKQTKQNKKSKTL